VRVVYYGIDGATFRPASDDERAQVRAELDLGQEPAIGFVGALGDSRKGFDTLFEAWALLARRGVDARLLVLGRGGALSHWQQRARDAGLLRSLRFLGFRRDIGRVLGALDGVVAPTRYEAFGQAVHEALCCGLPAVVSARAGVAERISPALGGLLLGDEQSPGELADKLDLLLAQLGNFRDEARRLAEVLRRRSWDTMAAEISAAMEG
jgi:glycosyltransferase involved in cell wall biosynthesis